MKFHLQTKLQRSPRWHKSHLQDLFTMEAKFAMFPFLTFTSKEMSLMGKIQPNRRIIQKHSNEHDMERLFN